MDILEVSMSKTEQQLQAECYQWFHANFISLRRMLFHVDNNSGNAIVGNQKKAQGVIRGPSDFVFITEFAVTFIEMKLPGRTQEPEQIDFMNKVRDRGHAYYLCYTFEQFKELICNIIGK